MKEKEKILSMTTPTARKEHICAVCGKPINKGEQYFCVNVKVGRKLISRRTHYNCHYTDEKPLVPQKVDQLAQSKTLISEQQFKEAIKEDCKMMLEQFSFQENMEITMSPLIITEVAWKYALSVTKMAAQQRIPQTVKLSRTVKMLREEYIKNAKKDLTPKSAEKLFSVSEEFYQEHKQDFTVLWFTISNKLLQTDRDLPYHDVRVEAYCSLVMCELYKRQQEYITKLVGERTGTWMNYSDPKTEALRDCMEAYIAPATIDFDGHIQVALNIFTKYMKDIKYSLT